MQVGEGQREREREGEGDRIPGRLHAFSTEPSMGLDSTNYEIIAELKSRVRCSTN